MAWRTIQDIEVSDVQKRRIPTKHYVYVIKVTWSDGMLCVVYRRYSQFFDFQCGLLDKFPEEGGEKDPAKRIIPILPGKIYFGRSQIRKVALERLVAINEYCETLIRLPFYISQCDEVLEFFETESDDINVPVEQEKPKSSKAESISKPKVPHQYLAIADYGAQQRGEVSLTQGMLVDVIEQTETGWWFVSLEDEHGWVPSTYLVREDGTEDISTHRAEPGHEEQYMCTESYIAAGPDEVTLRKGALVDVIEKNMQGWWLVRIGGTEGWAPATYLAKHSSPVTNNTISVAQTSSTHTDSSNRKEFKICRNSVKGGSMKPPPRSNSLSRNTNLLNRGPSVSEKPKQYVTVAYFADTVGDGITFEEGEVATILEKTPSGWWFVKIRGEKGWVPASYLQSLDSGAQHQEHADDDEEDYYESIEPPLTPTEKTPTTMTISGAMRNSQWNPSLNTVSEPVENSSRNSHGMSASAINALACVIASRNKPAVKSPDVRPSSIQKLDIGPTVVHRPQTRPPTKPLPKPLVAKNCVSANNEVISSSDSRSVVPSVTDSRGDFKTILASSLAKTRKCSLDDISSDSPKNAIKPIKEKLPIASMQNVNKLSSNSESSMKNTLDLKTVSKRPVTKTISSPREQTPHPISQVESSENVEGRFSVDLLKRVKPVMTRMNDRPSSSSSESDVLHSRDDNINRNRLKTALKPPAVKNKITIRDCKTSLNTKDSVVDSENSSTNSDPDSASSDLRSGSKSSLTLEMTNTLHNKLVSNSSDLDRITNQNPGPIVPPNKTLFRSALGQPPAPPVKSNSGPVANSLPPPPPPPPPLPRCDSETSGVSVGENNSNSNSTSTSKTDLASVSSDSLLNLDRDNLYDDSSPLDVGSDANHIQSTTRPNEEMDLAAAIKASLAKRGNNFTPPEAVSPVEAAKDTSVLASALRQSAVIQKFDANNVESSPFGSESETSSVRSCSTVSTDRADLNSTLKETLARRRISAYVDVDSDSSDWDDYDIDETPETSPLHMPAKIASASDSDLSRFSSAKIDFSVNDNSVVHQHIPKEHIADSSSRFFSDHKNQESLMTQDSVNSVVCDPSKIFSQPAVPINKPKPPAKPSVGAKPTIPGYKPKPTLPLATDLPTKPAAIGKKPKLLPKVPDMCKASSETESPVNALPNKPKPSLTPMAKPVLHKAKSLGLPSPVNVNKPRLPPTPDKLRKEQDVSLPMVLPDKPKPPSKPLLPNNTIKPPTPVSANKSKWPPPQEIVSAFSDDRVAESCTVTKQSVLNNSLDDKELDRLRSRPKVADLANRLSSKLQQSDINKRMSSEIHIPSSVVSTQSAAFKNELDSQLRRNSETHGIDITNELHSPVKRPSEPHNAAFNSGVGLRRKSETQDLKHFKSELNSELKRQSKYRNDDLLNTSESRLVNVHELRQPGHHDRHELRQSGNRDTHGTRNINNGPSSAVTPRYNKHRENDASMTSSCRPMSLNYSHTQETRAQSRPKSALSPADQFTLAQDTTMLHFVHTLNSRFRDSCSSESDDFVFISQSPMFYEAEEQSPKLPNAAIHHRPKTPSLDSPKLRNNERQQQRHGIDVQSEMRSFTEKRSPVLDNRVRMQQPTTPSNELSNEWPSSSHGPLKQNRVLPRYDYVPMDDPAPFRATRSQPVTPTAKHAGKNVRPSPPPRSDSLARDDQQVENVDEGERLHKPLSPAMTELTSVLNSKFRKQKEKVDGGSGFLNTNNRNVNNAAVVNNNNNNRNISLSVNNNSGTTGRSLINKNVTQSPSDNRNINIPISASPTDFDDTSGVNDSESSAPLAIHHKADSHDLVYRTTAAWVSENTGELSFDADVDVIVQEKDESGWWYIVVGDDAGWAPSTYLMDICETNSSYNTQDESDSFSFSTNSESNSCNVSRC